MSVSSDYSTIAAFAEAAISARFEEAAERFANEEALSCGDHTLTYDELNRAANRVAHAIVERTGPECKPVVLIAERSCAAVVGLLGIVKAGKFCVPVQTSNNEHRILNTVLAEMERPLVVTHGNLVESVRRLASGGEIIDIESPGTRVNEDNPGRAGGPDDLAFVIYTSGSTGSPKGVLHNHRNILHRIFWYSARFGVGSRDRTMMLSSAEHISGVIGMLRPLMTGGKLRVFDIRLGGFHGLVHELQSRRITILPIMNTVFRRFVDCLDPETRFPDLRLIILGGERLLLGDVERYRRHFPDTCLLLNTLGCTELPTYRYYVIDKQTALPDGPIPAGYAVADISATLVDAEGNALQEGERGEILVSSRYLALGYWKRPAETESRFGIAADGQRTFRTGDMGILRDDGALVHLGRDDWMIKILGNRVEFAEVEDAIRRHPSIRDAAIMNWPDEASEPRLYAYIAPEQDWRPAETEVKDFVRAQLPDYMVPYGVLAMSELPLTRSGKVDRRALPAPDSISPEVRTPEVREGYTPPRNDLELNLIKAWEAVLRLSPIGVHDNFFDLGGNSLLAVSLSASIRKTSNADLSPAVLFHAPTVDKLAQAIRSNGASSTSYYSLVPIQTGGARIPLFTIHNTFHDLIRRLGPDQPAYGLRYAIGVRLPKPIPLPMIEDLAAHYIEELQRIQAQGPYFLIGHSFGGLVAFEMAGQLAAQGQCVGLVALCDTFLNGASRPAPFFQSIARLLKLSPRLMIGKLCHRIANLYISRLRYGDGYLPHALTPHPTVVARLAYSPKPFSGRVLLFKAQRRDSILLDLDPVELGWRGLVRGQLDIMETPGDHASMIQEPHVRILAEALRIAMDDASGHCD